MSQDKSEPCPACLSSTDHQFEHTYNLGCLRRGKVSTDLPRLLELAHRIRADDEGNDLVEPTPFATTGTANPQSSPITNDIDSFIKQFIPHVGHQYCDEPCPAYQARTQIESMIIEARKFELQAINELLTDEYSIKDYIADRISELQRGKK